MWISENPNNKIGFLFNHYNGSKLISRKNNKPDKVLFRCVFTFNQLPICEEIISSLCRSGKASVFHSVLLALEPKRRVRWGQRQFWALLCQSRVTPKPCCDVRRLSQIMSDPIPIDSVYEELSGLRGGKWEYTVYLYSNERNHISVSLKWMTQYFLLLLIDNNLYYKKTSACFYTNLNQYKITIQ